MLGGKSFGSGGEKFRVRGGNEGLGFDPWGALAGSAPPVATGGVGFAPLPLPSKEKKSTLQTGWEQAQEPGDRKSPPGWPIQDLTLRDTAHPQGPPSISQCRPVLQPPRCPWVESQKPTCFSNQKNIPQLSAFPVGDTSQHRVHPERSLGSP